MLTGATAAGEEMTAARIGAIVVAVLVSAMLWALYFGRDERRAQKLFAEAEGRHHLVRDAFTYYTSRSSRASSSSPSRTSS